MIRQHLEELSADPRWRTVHLDFRFTPTLREGRRVRVEKLLELGRVCARVSGIVLRYGRADLVLYPSGGPHLVPIVRDLLLLPVVRSLGRQLWVQFHAAGIKERLDEAPYPLAVALRAAYGQVDGAIVMTRFNCRDPAALGVERLEVVPHQLEDANPSGQLPDPRAAPVVLHVGHLSHDKGTPELVEAFARLTLARPDARLRLMGEFLPPYGERECRQRIAELGLQERVELLGCLEGEAKWRAFATSHVFAFSSVAPYESFGLVMAEAMMWGLPIVATEWRANREVAGDAALYVAPADGLVDALAAGLTRACDTSWRATTAPNARARFVERYARRSSLITDFVAKRLGV
jgi:glycosyltransferase involved in cell wall biosynthesis